MNFEPGTVAVATVRGVPNVRVFRVEAVWLTADRVEEWFEHDDSEVTDIRPLIVLDPGALDMTAEGAVGHLRWLTRHTEPTHTFDQDKMAHASACAKVAQIADAIETQSRPPRIPEPGLWGVVEASVETNGRTRGRFVRDTKDTWTCLDWPGDYGWKWLVDPTVVRPGIGDAS